MKTIDRAQSIVVCLVIVLVISPLLIAWNPFSKVKTEFAMNTGMVIEATNRFGTIRIEAGDHTRRTYTWVGGSESIRLRKRRSRWFGSLGIYHPGGGRRVHLVVEEGQQHFCCEREAKEWVIQQRQRMDWQCTKNGLVVGWYRTRKPDSDYWAVIVEVWQIYLKGRKPTLFELGPATPSVRVTGQSITTRAHSVSDFVPSEPRVIRGRLYSGKAQDLMAEGEITAGDVEETIATGVKGLLRNYLAFSRPVFRPSSERP